LKSLTVKFSARAEPEFINSEHEMPAKEARKPQSVKVNEPKSDNKVATIVPSYSLTKSKKGVLHLWIQLPRSVPQSCLNMDAKPTHFHLDTKGWGANYEIDIPFPPESSVILREGEEAEAEFQGGVLKVRFQTAESEQNGSSVRAAKSNKRDRTEPSNTKDGSRLAKRQKKEEKAESKGLCCHSNQPFATTHNLLTIILAGSAKPAAAAAAATTVAPATKPRKPAAAKPAQAEKEGSLKLIDDISSAEETRIQVHKWII
jgi:hypothetical protein